MRICRSPRHRHIQVRVFDISTNGIRNRAETSQSNSPSTSCQIHVTAASRNLAFPSRNLQQSLTQFSFDSWCLNENLVVFNFLLTFPLKDGGHRGCEEAGAGDKASAAGAGRGEGARSHGGGGEEKEWRGGGGEEEVIMSQMSLSQTQPHREVLTAGRRGR